MKEDIIVELLESLIPLDLIRKLLFVGKTTTTSPFNPIKIAYPKQ